MKAIRDLIAAKRQQIALLEKHIGQLEEMATEEEKGGAVEADTPQAVGRGRGRAARTVRAGRRRRRGRGRADSRAAQIEAYLKEHAGPQPATEIASALGFKPADVHSAIYPGLKKGRFGRGRSRGSYVLGTPGPARRTQKTRGKRTRGRKKGARRPRAKAGSEGAGTADRSAG